MGCVSERRVRRRLGRQRRLETAGQTLQRRQELRARLFERQTLVDHGRERAGNLVDGLFEVRVVPRQRERRFVKHERLGELPTAMVNLRHAADGRQVLGRVFEHVFQLGLRRVEIVHLEQRATQRHAGGEIPWMDGKPGSAGCDRVFVAASPPVLFGELRKRNRRRVLLDPASKFFNTWIVRHGYSVPLRRVAALLNRHVPGCRCSSSLAVGDRQRHHIRASRCERMLGGVGARRTRGAAVAKVPGVGTNRRTGRSR